MTTLILTSLLSVLIAAWVLLPFLKFQEKPYFNPNEAPHVFDEKLSLLESIQELENDFNQGKLTKEEFEALSNEAKHEYLDLKHQDD